MKHDYICHSGDKIFLFPDGFGTLWARLTCNIKLRSISYSISLAGMMAACSIVMMVGKRMSLRRIAPGHHGLTIYVAVEDGILHSCEPQLLFAKPEHSAEISAKFWEVIGLQSDIWGGLKRLCWGKYREVNWKLNQTQGKLKPMFSSYNIWYIIPTELTSSESVCWKWLPATFWHTANLVKKIINYFRNFCIGITGIGRKVWW